MSTQDNAAEAPRGPWSEEFETFLHQAREAAASGVPQTASIRWLVRQFGAKRRGVWIVDRLQRVLDAHGLVTEPHFSEGWLDDVVELRLATRTAEATQEEPRPPNKAGSEDVEHVRLTVAKMPAATSGLLSVRPTDELARVRSLMLRHDYSQLGVASGVRELVGAVSWESMAKATMRGSEMTLRDAMIPAAPVSLDEDLIALVPRIIEEGFVFVARRDRTLCGIVTTADLGQQFADLANPFFLVGEIERRLRLILSSHFDLEEISQSTDPADSTRTVASPDDLTLGEVIRILENGEHWDRIGWPLERKEFVGALHDVREIRNDVMHFSPDPLGEEELEKLRNFLGWLRVMEPTI